MTVFLVRRLLGAACVLLFVSLVAFCMFRYVGDPVAQMLGPDASVQDREQLRGALGLDRPMLAQFGVFQAQLMRGELGVSLRQGRPVRDILAERIPATLELAGVSAVLAVVGGLVIGVYCAVHPQGMGSRAMMALSLAGASLPTFLIGILLILAFSVTAGWLPSYGRGELQAIGWWRSGLLTVDGWRHMLLPALTLAAFQLALIVRLARAEMMEVLRSDFIKFARARGIPERTIRYAHALRNALLPVVTVIGLQLGSIVAFALVTETVFQWPGLGALFAEAVAFADIPVIAAYLCFVAALFVVINLVVDLAYSRIDPRLKAAG
ncbi:ABC transporter permease [Xenophilus sp.]|uniref:ABC transporter permease n=1 Tax=Xenophilus sp. TaxID=1873499 RepID=UPI0037DCC45F